MAVHKLLRTSVSGAPTEIISRMFFSPSKSVGFLPIPRLCNGNRLLAHLIRRPSSLIRLCSYFCLLAQPEFVTTCRLLASQTCPLRVVQFESTLAVYAHPA